jgi:transcriptional regulator with XRE-family HTH domain
MYRSLMRGSAVDKLAATIRRIREEAGLSMRSFGERLKVCEESVRLYENGQRTPSKVVLQRIIEVGQIPPATATTLLHLRERMPQPAELNAEEKHKVTQRIVRVVELFLKESDVLLIEPAKKGLHERIVAVLGEEFDAFSEVHKEGPQRGVHQQQPAHPKEQSERRRRQASPHLRDW